MRISLISEHASPLAALGGEDAGGQNVYVAELARGLGERGHDVTVYTRRDSTQLDEVVPLAPRVRVRHITAGPPSPLPKDELAPFMTEFGQRMARDWLCAGVPDIVHAHFWMSGLAARAALRTVTVPMVLTFHALGVVKRRHQGHEDTSPPGRLAAECELLAAADAVTASCSDELRELEELGAAPDRVHIVPCGVELDRFRPDPRRRPSPFWNGSGLRRVVSLGRLVPRKGVDVVVRALAQLPDAELVIAGGPDATALDRFPEALRLREVARAAGVEKRVRLIGRLDRDRSAELLASADVVAITPQYEPFGMVPLEAMASGRPVVGTAVGGLLDSVADGVTGILVPPGNPDATAAALRTLLDDPVRADTMGAAGRRRVEELFGWPRVVSLTEQAYAAARERHERDRPSRLGHTRDWLTNHARELRAAVDHCAGQADSVERWSAQLAATLLSGGRLITAGNGGSAAEAQHFTAELVGRFVEDRLPLSAISLVADTSSLTAITNDFGADEAFARQVEAHARAEDVLLLLSTSGRSSNILAAARRARLLGIRVWALTGQAPNPLADLADDVISVPSADVSVVQECHLMLLHALAAGIDQRLPSSQDQEYAHA